MTNMLRDLKKAERTIRAWQLAARQMNDLAIKGDCVGVRELYFNTAMRLPFYGADPDPLPSDSMYAEFGPNLPVEP